MRVERLGLGITLTMHVLAAVFLLSYEPARKALLAAAPIMVELVTPPRAEEPKPPTELPKPKPVTKSLPKVVEPLPVLTAPVDAPSPITAPPPPPAPPAPAEVSAPPAPLTVTQPIFNADYLNNPAPLYPTLSRRYGEQGKVILRVLVNARGTADEVQIFTSSGFRRLDEAAFEAVRRWKFVPAKRGAEAVQAWVRIPIPFILE